MLRTCWIPLVIPDDQATLYMLVLLGHRAGLLHHVQHALGDPHGVAVYAPEAYGPVFEKRMGGEVFL